MDLQEPCSLTRHRIVRRCCSLKQPVFSGVATALVTPFSGGRIDWSALDGLLERQLAAKIPALVLAGTTGEASTLSAEEKSALWRHCADYVRSRAVLIAGVGTNDTAASVRLARLASDCGADALLAVTPYYNKCTQDGLAVHYTAIADATALPLILYNVPGRTGVNLLPETARRLSAHPRIAGLKEASGSISQAAKVKALCGEAFSVWSGNDDQTVPMLSLGADGVISVLSNLLPGQTAAMVHAAQRGDRDEAAYLQLQLLPLIDALFSRVNPIPVKAALALRGLCKNELRLPLTPMPLGEARPLFSELLEQTDA